MIVKIFFLVDFFVCLFLFLMEYSNLSVLMYITTFTTAMSLYNIFTIYNFRLSLSSVILLYTIVTQFGLIIPYYYIGSFTVSEYEYWTLEFLENKYLIPAILIGNIAIISYEISRLFIVKQSCGKDEVNIQKHNVHKKKKIYNISTSLLILVVIYFVYFIFLGGTTLFGSYGDFNESSLRKNFLYPFILIMFYLGSLYLSTCGDIKSNKLGWILWILIASLFALNGNKGEFLYPLLAILGLKGVQGTKTSLQTIVFIAFIMFIAIPTITALRGLGLVSNLSNASTSLYSGFVEIGMQLRTSVYTLEFLDIGTINFLYGQSYWQPILNIITPFMDHDVAAFQLKVELNGFGYNQVIESYLNFGIIGVILFFGLLGGVMCMFENKYARDEIKLAFLGSITCTLLNATRNYFAFVPGHVLVAYIFYLLIKKYALQNK